MDSGVSERVMIERIEMIARLASGDACQEKDRVIALSLIADMLKAKDFPVVFSLASAERLVIRGGRRKRLSRKMKAKRQ